MKEMSDDDFRKIVRKVIKLISTRDPQEHAEVAKERRR